MNLWPFSKKDAEEFVLDTTLDLPPGVVLADPDDPTLADLPAPSVPSPPSATETPVDPATVGTQAASLPTTNDPPLSPEIQQMMGLSSTPEPVVRPPTLDLPDLPAELFGSAATDLAAASANLSELATDQNPGLWTSDALEQAFDSPEPLNLDMPSVIPGLAVSEPIVSDLFPHSSQQPGLLPVEPTVSAGFPIAPVQPVPMTASPEPVPEPISEALPEVLESVASVESPPLEASSWELPAPGLDSSEFHGDPMDDMAAFLPPPESSLEPSLEAASSWEMMPPAEESASALTDLLAGAAVFQMGSAHSVEPAVTQSDDELPLEIGTEPAESGGFAHASFDAMDHFGQVDSQAALFVPESDEMSVDGPTESYYAPMDEDMAVSPPAPESVALEGGMQWMPGLDGDESDLPEAIYALDGEAYIPGQALADDVDGAFYELDESIESEPVEVSGGGTLDAYDLGHYDDPDEPTTVFSLDATDSMEAPETNPPAMAHQPDTPETLSAVLADVLAVKPEAPELAEVPDVLNTQSALFYEYPQEPLLSDSPVGNSQSEEAQPYTAMGCPEPQEVLQPKPVARQQAPEVKPPPQPNVVEPQPPARPIPLPPAMTQLTQVPIPPKLPPQHACHMESITDALENFEQEMLLQDNHFLTQSINNLVDRYFSQKTS